MIANLDKQEIDKVWQYADIMEGKDNDEIRLDVLGAEIHRGEYGKDSPYGWCVEYVISPEELQQEGISTQNRLCEANVRILHCGNYASNIGHKRGYYERHVNLEGNVNKIQYSWQISNISEFGISKLQKAFGLTKEHLQKFFPER